MSGLGKESKHSKAKGETKHRELKQWRVHDSMISAQAQRGKDLPQL